MQTNSPAVKQRTPQLLIIDDDRPFCGLVRDYLLSEGISLDIANTGAEGIRLACGSDVDLIILDVMLPDMKGFEVLRTLRNSILTPVLMLTAKGDDLDRILGLELGADDYLPKPFNPRELVARISAILRRSAWRPEQAAARPVAIEFGDIQLDPDSHSVQQSGHPVKLTPAEFGILQEFLKVPGAVLTRQELAEKILGRQFSPFDRSIDLHVSNLRHKLGPHQGGKERICSIRGTGYLYAWPDEQRQLS